MPLFVAKYKTYTRTKAIRIPEEMADLILELTHDLDSYNERTKDKEDFPTVEKLLHNIKNKVRALAIDEH